MAKHEYKYTWGLDYDALRNTIPPSYFERMFRKGKRAYGVARGAVGQQAYRAKMTFKIFNKAKTAARNATRAAAFWRFLNDVVYGREVYA